MKRYTYAAFAFFSVACVLNNKVSLSQELIQHWSTIQDANHSTDDGFVTFLNGLSSSAFVESDNGTGLWLIGGLYFDSSTNSIQLSNLVFYFEYDSLQLHYIGSLQWTPDPIESQSYKFYCKHQCAVNINQDYIAIVNPSIEYNIDINRATHANVKNIYIYFVLF